MGLRDLMRIPFVGRLVKIAILGVILLPFLALARVAIWATGITGLYIRAPQGVSFDVSIDGRREPVSVQAGGHKGYDLWRGAHTIEVTGGSNPPSTHTFDVTAGGPWTDMFSLGAPIVKRDVFWTPPDLCYALVDITDAAYDRGPPRVGARIEGGAVRDLADHRSLGSYIPLWLDDGERLEWWVEIPCDPWLTTDDIAAIAMTAVRRSQP